MQIYIEAKDSFDWVNALVTLLSVILGAALAYAATRVSERRKERAAGIANATMLALKLRNVIDGIFRLDRELREGMIKAKEAGVDAGPAWTQIPEISGIGDYEEVITVEDMSILAQLEKYDLLESTTELRDGHNGVIRALVLLFRLRHELAEVMPPQQVQGNVASFEGVLTPEAGMLIGRLNTLSDGIIASLKDMKEQARDVAPKFHRELKAALKVKTFPLVTLPDELSAEARGDEPKASRAVRKAEDPGAEGMKAP
jgi:hypothetical protein